MSHIVIPSRRTQQPGYAVRVRAEYERDLLSLVNREFRYRLPITTGASGQTATTIAAASGLGWKFNSGTITDRIYNVDATPDKSLGYPATFISYLRPDGATTGSVHCLGALANASDHFARVYMFDTGNILRAQANGSATGTASTTGTWTAGRDYSMAAVFRSISSRTPYLNGVAGATDTTNIGTTTNLDKLTYGAYVGAISTYACNATMYYGAWWLRAFDANEITEFARYPWMWASRDSRRIYFTTAAAAFNAAWNVSANSVVQPGAMVA